jgi:hypothetical protein
MCDVGGRASLGCIPGRIPGTSGAIRHNSRATGGSPLQNVFVKLFKSLAPGRAAGGI